ncbi:protein RIC-3 [Pholidichthys leucotaenia]
MTITTCQKVTLISCSVLCVSLFLPRMLLPREKKEMGQPEAGPGFYPPGMHQQLVPKDPDQWAVDSSYSIAHTAEAIAKVKGFGRSKKYNLMAQVIPIYGFGILLYILYIIYKLTCKGKTNKSGNYIKLATRKTENAISEYELARLQERLIQTEMMMERIVSGQAHCSHGSGRRRKSRTAASKKEEKLLRQLREITALMQEGRLEGASPEMEAEEVPYGADWEGYPEETYPDEPCKRHGYETATLEGITSQPTAEALAERMEQEEEGVTARKLSVVREEEEDEDEQEDNTEEEEEDGDEEEEEIEENIEGQAEDFEEEEDSEDEDEKKAEKKQLLSLPPSRPKRRQETLGLEVKKELQSHNTGKKQISFSDHKDVYHYPKEDTYEDDEEDEKEEDEGTEVDEEEEEEDEPDEDDPVMEAESLQFTCESSANPEEDAEEDKEEYLLKSTPVDGGSPIHADTTKDVRVSGLRMRTRRET